MGWGQGRDGGGEVAFSYKRQQEISDFRGRKLESNKVRPARNFMGSKIAKQSRNYFSKLSKSS